MKKSTTVNVKITHLVLMLSSLLLTSCYSNYYTYKGNAHQQAMGKTKNEILRSYGVPERTQDDGAGGSILIYEQFKQTTVSNSNTAAYGARTTSSAAIYSNSGMVGASNSQSGQVSSTNGISQTTMSKDFCYLYVNPSNVVYDFKTNYGALYNQNRCFNRLQTWVWVGYSCLFVIPAVVTVPVAIIAQKKAKKRGEICK
jgi:hypothetical protein